MDRSFRKSLFYSTLFHIAMLLLIYFIYHSFLVVQTPLLMDVTLVGENSKGNDLGAPSAQQGVNVPQVSKLENNPQISNPENVRMPENKDTGEVSVKKKVHRQPTPSPAKLAALNKSAPIGLEGQKDTTTDIKTTTGVGQQSVAGSPEGNADIEGQLAGRAIKHKVFPVYPDWAKKQGVEATVVFQLTVLPNGLLKLDELQLDQTCGHRELDKAVYDALIQWEFMPLEANVPQQNQSGTIKVSFNLKDQP